MRKLAFIRLQGYGNRTWDRPRYMIPGVSPSHSIYDAPEDVKVDAVGDHNTPYLENARGFTRVTDDYPVEELTSTRTPRIGAQFSSLAAMRVFQSTFQTNWDHLFIDPNFSELRQLNVNYNPNQQGSKEQQRATVYNPWPSAGALYPKAV